MEGMCRVNHALFEHVTTLVSECVQQTVSSPHFIVQAFMQPNLQVPFYPKKQDDGISSISMFWPSYNQPSI